MKIYFKSKFCGTEICSTEYEGYTCDPNRHTPATPNPPHADTKNSFEECKTACSQKHSDKVGIVAFYNSTNSKYNWYVQSCGDQIWKWFW